MALVVCQDCHAEHSDTAPACPRCGRVAPAPPAYILNKREAGVGCVVQVIGGLIGLCLLPFIPVGTVLGIALIVASFVWGARLGDRFRCGACGNAVASLEVKSCPACRASLSKPGLPPAG